MKRILLLSLSLLLACTPDWSTDGTVGWRRIDVKARGVDVVPVFLATPWNGQGPTTTNAASVVLVPGGFVEPERYEWLALELARHGRAVAIPSFPLDLAILSAGDVQVAQDVLLEGHAPSDTPALSSGRVAAIGHSLGGVVASEVAEDFDALVLLASYPAAGDDVENGRLPVLSIAGELDCDTGVEDARSGVARFGGSKLFALVEGLTHYGFTDSLLEDRERGCAPRLELEEGHERIVTLVDLFLQSALDGSRSASEQLFDLPGVTVEEVR